MIANQAAKLPFNPLFGNQFDPAITGVTLGTGNIGLLHVEERTLSRAQMKETVPSN
jgi:hypothetical protein